MSMIFTKEQIMGMQFHKSPNKILVKPTRGSSEIVMSNGVKIYLDDRFEKERHAPTSGTIAAHCGNLVANKMPWETTNEIQSGDYCVFSFESAVYALDEAHGRVLLDEDNEAYLLIDYEDIFCVRRGETIIPVNGYLLVSPIEEKQLSDSFTIVRENNNSTKCGLVEYIGTPNKRYFFSGVPRDDVSDFDDEISVGDVIVFNANSDLPLEYSLHKSVAKNAKTFFRLQRRDIDAIIPSSEKEKYGF